MTCHIVLCCNIYSTITFHSVSHIYIYIDMCKYIPYIYIYIILYIIIYTIIHNITVSIYYIIAYILYNI